MSRSGILPVDKPEGPTSHDIVARARRLLGVRRIGHTGTLDPFASGLLLLCVGPATRLVEYMTDLPKQYVARVRFGTVMDTDDRTGSVLEAHDAASLDEGAIREAFAAQVGTISQRPPSYSAKKIAGRRAYALAREGRDVRPAETTVMIHEIEIREIELPDVVFEVRCGSGTYIRSIARDVGEALGVGGHLRDLRRTAIGHHTVAGAVSLGDAPDDSALDAAFVSPADAVGHLPSVRLRPEEVEAVRNGRRVRRPEEVAGAGPVAVLAPDGSLLAVAEVKDDGLQPRKVVG